MNWPFRALRLLVRLTLAQQLVLLALLPATVATLGAIAVLTRQHLANVTELMRANAQTVALQVATVAQSQLQRMDRRAMQRTAQSGSYQPHVQQVQIWSEDGEILANSETQDRQRGEGLQVVAPIVADDGKHAGKVMVEISLDAVERAKRSVWLNVVLVLARQPGGRGAGRLVGGAPHQRADPGAGRGGGPPGRRRGSAGGGRGHGRGAAAAARLQRGGRARCRKAAPCSRAASPTPPPSWPARTSSWRWRARPRRACWPPPATTCASRCTRSRCSPTAWPTARPTRCACSASATSANAWTRWTACSRACSTSRSSMPACCSRSGPTFRSTSCSTRSAATSGRWPSSRTCGWWCARPSCGCAATT